MRKPFFEKVTTPGDASWALLDRRLDNEIPFEWHHHPEFELTLTLNSRGQRYVGDSIEAYDDGDLVLVGPNLPHTWNSSEKIEPDRPHVALVMWFKPEWIEGLMALLTELRPLEPMLTSASRGIVFSSLTSQKVRPLIEEMRLLAPLDRLPKFLEVLVQLIHETHPRYLTITLKEEQMPVTGLEQAHVELILDYIHEHYYSAISNAELAEQVGLSLSGFHRLFRRHLRMTVSEYISRLRIGKACALLITTEQPVAYIANITGYDNLANFNRQFKALKLVTPREFRQRFRK
ncbi:MAG TPA: AraC family transcriptional regulator [Chloroflexia bacterium]|nr:AraC family transcriptional regulator [Chloroflexia bacterium]